MQCTGTNVVKNCPFNQGYDLYMAGRFVQTKGLLTNSRQLWRIRSLAPVKSTRSLSRLQMWLAV